MSFAEKRRFPRLKLSIEDGYFGNLRLPDNGTLIAPIMNLSAGGLNLAVAVSSKDKFKQGDIVFLRNISGGANLAFLSDVKAEIRWIRRLEKPPYMSVGCRFKGISEQLRAQIASFVSSERMTRGQYD